MNAPRTPAPVRARTTGAGRQRVVRKHGERALERVNTREALIRCGIECLTEQGFRTTSIEEVLNRVGVPKGSFYHFFKSKDDFGTAVINSYVEYYTKKMGGIFHNENKSPLDRLRDFIEVSKQGMVRFQFRRGCLVGNMGQELANVSDTFRHQLEAVLQSWEDLLTECLQRAIDVGEIAPNNDPRSLSRFFWLGWEGAILRAKLMRSAEPIDHFADLFFERVAV